MKKTVTIGEGKCTLKFSNGYTATISNSGEDHENYYHQKTSSRVQLEVYNNKGENITLHGLNDYIIKDLTPDALVEILLEVRNF